MHYFRICTLITVAVLLGAPTAPLTPAQNLTAIAADWPIPTGKLSVMTFNVKDLPWPVASGRRAALAAIGQRLAAMRARGIQPDVVLLQEAFGKDARAIGTLGGYTHIIDGPQDAATARTPPMGDRFAAEARFLKGETSGSLINSGLVILSDVPITRVERHAFPQGACAGFDCLAAKGVLIAWARVPGTRLPVALVNTHLNSRGAANVPVARADTAHAWQVKHVRALLAERIPRDAAVILGGDFNVGTAPARVKSFSQPLLAGGASDILAVLLRDKMVEADTAREAAGLVQRNKDKIIARDGDRLRLVPKRARVPFGLEEAEPLSDHAGFTVEFALVLKDSR